MGWDPEGNSNVGMLGGWDRDSESRLPSSVGAWRSSDKPGDTGTKPAVVMKQESRLEDTPGDKPAMREPATL